MWILLFIFGIPLVVLLIVYFSNRANANGSGSSSWGGGVGIDGE